MKACKLIGLAAIFIMVFSLCCELGVKSANAALTIQTGESQMTLNNADQLNPDIHQYGLNHFAVVWQDNRNGDWDIYMYFQNYLGEGNWDVQWDTQITTNSGNNESPKIYDDAVVYQSDRNGNWDIYMYNITSKVETQITTNTAIQSNPEIYGNIIVWQDTRNAVWSSNYNDYYPWNIYMYNLTTHTEQRISRQNEDTFSPAISGNRLAYIKKVFTYIPGAGIYPGRYVYSPYVCSYDLSTGIETDVHTVSSLLIPLSIPNYINSPAIDGTRIVWTMKEPSESGWNVEMRDVLTGANWKSALGSFERPDIGENYIVYQSYGNGNWDIYLHDFGRNLQNDLIVNSADQINPVLTTEYSDFIVYQDNRHGNWDIYLTAFWYGAMGGGPSPAPPITPSLVISYLQEVRSRIADTPTSDFAGAKSKVRENRRNAMLHQLDSAIADVEAAAYTQKLKLRTKYLQSAIDQLNGLIGKVDGWSLRGSADVAGSGFTPDWITGPFFIDQMVRSCRNYLQTLLNGIT